MDRAERKGKEKLNKEAMEERYKTDRKQRLRKFFDWWGGKEKEWEAKT